ncbi:MAG: hypothetical protein ACXQT1_02585 [Methermicoccaceae archaeon]
MDVGELCLSNGEHPFIQKRGWSKKQNNYRYDKEHEQGEVGGHEQGEPEYQRCQPSKNKKRNQYRRIITS